MTLGYISSPENVFSLYETFIPKIRWAIGGYKGFGLGFYRFAGNFNIHLQIFNLSVFYKVK